MLIRVGSMHAVKMQKFLSFDPSDACYHVGPDLTSPADAEVRCASMGGRLASFTKRQDVVDVRNVLMNYQARSEMWIGECFIALLLAFRT